MLNRPLGYFGSKPAVVQAWCTTDTDIQNTTADWYVSYAVNVVVQSVADNGDTLTLGVSLLIQIQILYSPSL